MEIEILQPIGFCSGVNNAISKVVEIKKNHPGKRIVVLGDLVHNAHVIEFLSSLGIINFVNNNDEVNKLNQTDIVVFTAHGHNSKTEELLKEKGIVFFDCICPKVAKNMQIIKDKINEGYEVIFVGYEKHPETVSTLSISNKIHLFDMKKGLNIKLNSNQKIFITNQTTLNIVELSKTFEHLKNEYKNAEISDEVCSATRIRQENLLKISDEADCIIVVGDKNSSNTSRLFEIGKNKKASTYLVSSESELTYDMVLNKEHIVVTSGTSAPNDVIDCVVAKIKKISK